MLEETIQVWTFSNGDTCFSEIHTNEDEKDKRKPLAYDEHEFQQVLKVV